MKIEAKTVRVIELCGESPYPDDPPKRFEDETSAIEYLQAKISELEPRVQKEQQKLDRLLSRFNDYKAALMSLTHEVDNAS